MDLSLTRYRRSCLAGVAVVPPPADSVAVLHRTPMPHFAPNCEFTH